ncbi:hypothetical protein [Streptomyces silvisoli]|uniref:DUF3558 domain-containing protein n=1 Tax=Streptomyces silvisoli TaxID=3034235 RepID=A0ABT5ZW71_9ACTN|nr:hypothetical protein [Streptomyces silvisoli]MDF3294073.1 hypothetical protein [Streptomyces silvisoli]
MEKSLYSPLFPTGKSVEQWNSGFTKEGPASLKGDANQGCSYRIDSKETLGLEEKWYTVDPRSRVAIGDAARQSSDGPVSNFKKIEGKYEAASWHNDTGATVGSIVNCSAPGISTKWRYALFINKDNATDEDEQVLRKLINPAMQALLDLRPCQKN